MKIKLLPDTVINQIAAGEVVERPASVVRELVDNAIDAGATDVFVALESGGHSRLKVRDNGCGMTRDEAILAFERHATSKVAKIEDLQHLSTMGFRGEALASIAAVSKINLHTRSREGDVGTCVTFRGGRLIDVQSCAWNEGTEIEVEHLFFNTPARRKFLKSPRSEMARIRTWLAHSSLARPDVRYRLVSDGDEVLNLPIVSSIEERARGVFSADLMPIRLAEGGISVQGMIGHPGQALSDATGLVILVNNRLVTDKIILRAVREGYDSMLKDREFPTGYIAVTMSAEDVDVNVHPQKSEVRFRRPDQLFAVVRGAVLAGVRSIRRPMSLGPLSVSTPPIETPLEVLAQQVFRDAPALPSVSQEPQRGFRFEPPPIPHASMAFGQTAVAEVASSYQTPGVTAQHAAPHNSDFRFSDLRYIGQALECYLLCQLGEMLVIVDMHAAHERVNYNRIRKARAERALRTQKLLIPEAIQLTEEQVIGLMEQAEALCELAFEVVQVTPDTVEVHGIPGVLSHLDCRSLIKEFASEPVVAGWRERLEERIDHIAARVACHASVRSGDTMSRHEAYALFAQMDEAELSGACPHGRPVVAQFSRDAVERWFGRDR
jgi:DNA mismatch repair protein MutL